MKRRGLNATSWLFAAAALGAGCTSGSGATADAAPPSGDAAADVRSDGATIETAQTDLPVDTSTTEAGVDRAPPMVNPDATRLVTGRLTLVGAGPNSCSHHYAGADTWCAYFRPSRSIGKTELWVINVTAAAAAPAMVNCMTGDANCIKLTDDLWTEIRPGQGFTHPYVHAFTGNTLIYYANASSGPGEHYVGPVHAWRPGFTAPQQISTNRGWQCIASFPGNNYAYCLDSNDSSSLSDVKFDYLAGPVANGAPILPKQDNVVCCETTNVVKYSARFSPDEKYFVWSGRHAVTDKETFWYKPVTDLAAGVATTPTKLFDAGESRLIFAADSSKIFYLANYNHNTTGSPSGDLMMNAFPPTAAPTQLDTQVGLVGRLADRAGAHKGVYYFRSLAMNSGQIWMLRDTSMATSKKMITPTGCSVDDISWSMNRMVFAKQCDTASYLSDEWAVALDPVTGAPGTECKLSNAITSSTWGLASLTEDGRWAYWADKVDTSIGVGDAKVTDLSTCTTTDTGRTIWAWDPVHSDGYIDNIASDGVDATIRYMDLRTAAPSATTPPVIQEAAAVIYSIPEPAYKMVVYTISKSSTATDGLWVYQKLPF